MTKPGPKRTQASMIGSMGELFVQAELSRFAVCNKLTNDFGFDLFCQLVENGIVGYPFFVQIKTVRQLQSDSVSIQLKASTARYWSTSPIPVFLIVCVLEPAPRFIWREAVSEIKKTYDRSPNIAHSSALRLTFSRSDLADETILSGIVAVVKSFADRRRLHEQEQDKRFAPTDDIGEIIKGTKVQFGYLLSQTTINWSKIVERLGTSPNLASEIAPHKWEEIVAGAFWLMGFSEVILTPRSHDGGRDIIATTRGIGQIKIIVSVKAYKPDHRVRYDDVRALLGVMSGEQDVSKALFITTSDFPPKILQDPFIRPFIPTRLELMNGDSLRDWLAAIRLKNQKPN